MLIKRSKKNDRRSGSSSTSSSPKQQNDKEYHKFDYQICIHQVTNLPSKQSLEYAVAWKRGSKFSGKTELLSVDRKKRMLEFSPGEEFSFPGVLILSKQKKRFLHKILELNVEDSRGKRVCSVSVDLSEFSNIQKNDSLWRFKTFPMDLQIPVNTPHKRQSKAKNPTLVMTLKSKYIGKAQHKKQNSESSESLNESSSAQYSRSQDHSQDQNSKSIEKSSASKSGSSPLPLSSSSPSLSSNSPSSSSSPSPFVNNNHNHNNFNIYFCTTQPNTDRIIHLSNT
eukprot:gb/GECH01009840.1/.p1 GENE.gb/GECH01009840.1/~~gb/GECH01009840.1/.p1  ORF type:complete len:282 (+),score=94.29 gb/GECH01009840.1/:1-846(+)